MFRAGLIVVVCAGFFTFSPMAKAQYYGGPGNGAPGYGQGGHCERLRERLHEIRHHIEWAQPWERERMEARAHELRERMRAECGGR